MNIKRNCYDKNFLRWLYSFSTDSDSEHIYGVVVTNFASDIASRPTCPASKQWGLNIGGKGGLGEIILFDPIIVPHHFTSCQHNVELALYQGGERDDHFTIFFFVQFCFQTISPLVKACSLWGKGGI